MEQGSQMSLRKPAVYSEGTGSVWPCICVLFVGFELRENRGKGWAALTRGGGRRRHPQVGRGLGGCLSGSACRCFGSSSWCVMLGRLSPACLSSCHSAFRDALYLLVPKARSVRPLPHWGGCRSHPLASFIPAACHRAQHPPQFPGTWDTKLLSACPGFMQKKPGPLCSFLMLPQLPPAAHRTHVPLTKWRVPETAARGFCFPLLQPPSQVWGWGLRGVAANQF